MTSKVTPYDNDIHKIEQNLNISNEKILKINEKQEKSDLQTKINSQLLQKNKIRQKKYKWVNLLKKSIDIKYKIENIKNKEDSSQMNILKEKLTSTQQQAFLIDEENTWKIVPLTMKFMI